MKQLRIVGTSHVSAESVAEIEQAMREHRPTVVAVELDYRRLHALFHGEEKLRLKHVRLVGARAFLFLAVARWLQQRIGRQVGVLPGADMKAAVVAAGKAGAKVALVDRDIIITVRRLMRALTWREKRRLLADVLLGLVGKGESAQLAKDFDVRRVPPDKVVDSAIAYLKKRYPAVHRVLVEERNAIMAKRVQGLLTKGERVLLVVGAGHKDIGRLIIHS